jgi:hypothetical protein
MTKFTAKALWQDGAIVAWTVEIAIPGGMPQPMPFRGTEIEARAEAARLNEREAAGRP